MSLLIAIKSCVRDLEAGCHDAIRETWGEDIRHAILRFFVGRNPINSCFELRRDEIVVDSKDDYDSLPDKTKKILQYSLNLGYDYTFLCDTDTFLIPNNLMSCGYQNYDYSGRFGNTAPLGVPYFYTDSRGNDIPNSYLAASGGVGYFLSKKAANIIVNHEEMTSWAEDLHVANVLGPYIGRGEIKACDLNEFECNVSWHLHHSKRFAMSIPDLQRMSYKLGSPTKVYDTKIKELRDHR